MLDVVEDQQTLPRTQLCCATFHDLLYVCLVTVTTRNAELLCNTSIGLVKTVFATRMNPEDRKMLVFLQCSVCDLRVNHTLAQNNAFQSLCWRVSVTADSDTSDRKT